MATKRGRAFFLRRPSDAAIDAERRRVANCPLSYLARGATRELEAGSAPPRGFVLDHNRVQLGRGAACYRASCAALQRWEMFATPFTWLAPREAPRIDDVVSILVRSHGLWSLNFSRIVYVEPTLARPRAELRDAYTFAYGTLTAHVESGEERFRVEWGADDAVWYDLLAFSRPGHPLVALGAPYARAMQRRFARSSKAAMLAATTNDPGGRP